jgi:hypothetical protein
MTASRNRMNRFIVEHFEGGARNPVAQVAMKSIAGREVDLPAEPGREIRAQIHERHETKSAVVDIREKIDVRPFGGLIPRK